MKNLKHLLIVKQVLILVLFGIQSNQLDAKILSGLTDRTNDPRTLSYLPQVGKIKHGPRGRKTCSATLIGRTCMISAAHCMRTVKKFKPTVEFNHIKKSRGCSTETCSKDSYDMNLDSLETGLVEVETYENGVVSGEKKIEDWAVFRLDKHKPLGWLKRWGLRESFSENPYLSIY